MSLGGRRSAKGIAVVGVRTDLVAEPVGDVTAVLGEGPYWVPEDDCLLWVDIHRGQLHRTYFPSGETATMDLGAAVGGVSPPSGGGILTAGGNRLAPAPARGARARSGPRGSSRKCRLREGIRFNDASVDPGRASLGRLHAH